MKKKIDRFGNERIEYTPAEEAKWAETMKKLEEVREIQENIADATWGNY